MHPLLEVLDYIVLPVETASGLNLVNAHPRLRGGTALIT